jgi:hypothetical protein
MKKIFACSMILAALCSIPAMAATTTVTGVVTDDMCGKKHMMTGQPEAVCIRACVKEGAHFAVTTDGKTYILSGKTSELNALAGKKATVSGELKGTTLTVSSVIAAK